MQYKRTTILVCALVIYGILWFFHSAYTSKKPKEIDISRIYKKDWRPDYVIMTTFLTSKGDPQPDNQSLRPKDLLTNDFSALEAWYASVLKHGLRAVIFYDNHSDEFIQLHENENVQFVKVALSKLTHYSLNDERFFLYDEFLQMCQELMNYEPRYVMFTDLFDLTFLKDPFPYLVEQDKRRREEIIKKYGKLAVPYNENRTSQVDSLFVGSEVTTMAFEWFGERIEECNITSWYDRDEFKDRSKVPLMNAGLIGGSYSIIREFLSTMIENFSFVNQNTNCNMPLFNFLTQTYYRDNIVTGAPLHTEFRKRETNTTCCYVQHK